MSSFALEGREEYTGHLNPAVSPRSKNCSIAPSFGLTSQKSAHLVLSPFSRFWTSLIDREVLNVQDCSLLSVLRVPPKNKLSLHSATILNHTIACSHTFFLEAKQT